MSGEANEFDGILDSLFEGFEQTSSDIAPAFGVAPLAPPPKPPDVAVSLDGSGRTALISSDANVFLQKLERDIVQTEKMLGLDPDESRRPLSPRRIMTPPEIEYMLAENPIFCPIKPDQADPLLERLPGQAIAGEVRYRIPAAPALERLQRLRELNQIYRERGDAIICRSIHRFFAAPRREFSRAAELEPQDRLELAEKFEELIDEGMNAIAGSQGHWDRDSRWPSALLLLQSMAVACGVAGGRTESLLELASLDRNLDTFDFQFMQTYVESYRISIKRLGIDLSQVEGGL